VQCNIQGSVPDEKSNVLLPKWRGWVGRVWQCEVLPFSFLFTAWMKWECGGQLEIRMRTAHGVSFSLSLSRSVAFRFFPSLSFLVGGGGR